jgi:fumarate reductase flavoprotein subunit
MKGDEMSKQNQFSRRDFIKQAAAVGAGVGATALLSGGLFPEFAHAAPAIPTRWDMEADVVIVGAGGTGLVAAIEAMEAGASVLLLDKQSAAGGTTSISGGVIQAAATQYQKEFTDVEGDTPAKHAEYWLKAAEEGVDPELVKLLAENMPANIDWLVEHGVNYVNVYGVDPIPYIDPELMAPRIHVPEGAGKQAAIGTGKYHVQALYDYAVKQGAEFLFKSPATGLVRDAEQGVIGVMAESNGKEIAVKANRAVILATSSFDHNKEMARAFSPQQYWALTKGICMASPAATGDGIRMAMEIGADLAGMGGTIGLPGTSIGTASIAGIWVNKYGQRFVNEAGHYAYVMRAVFDQEEHVAWAVFDAKVQKLGGMVLSGMSGMWSNDLSAEVEKGIVKKGATIPELARAMEVHPAQLEATVTAYNKDAATGTDTLFHKQAKVEPLDTPPFFATMFAERNLGAIGGVKINVESQVIDVHGQVIPRLYAGGMVAGGFIGPYYPGSGTAVASTVTFGRIAGKNAATEAPWSATT